MPEKTEWKLINSTVKSFEEDEELMEHWEYQDANLTYHVFTRYFFCNWGSMKQVTISKSPFKKKDHRSKEPNMREKSSILTGLEVVRTDEVALEVFPKKSKIVDRFDLYHVWILEQKNFPYYVKNIKMPQICRWQKAKVNGKDLRYKKRCIKLGNKKTEVYFVKSEDGLELVWYDKQNFKDCIVGENVTAVEYISGDANVTILICIPRNSENLPFGLVQSQ